VGIDFLKPQPLIGGLNVIQWCCLAGLLWLVVDWLRGGRGHYEQTAG
jgi:phosphatidylglycerol:prolipoprotein diacylglycerol transferase